MRSSANAVTDSVYINPAYKNPSTIIQHSETDLTWHTSCVSSISLSALMPVDMSALNVFDNNPNFVKATAAPHEDIEKVLDAKTEPEGCCISKECVEFHQEHPSLPEDMLGGMLH